MELCLKVKEQLDKVFEECKDISFYYKNGNKYLYFTSIEAVSPKDIIFNAIRIALDSSMLAVTYPISSESSELEGYEPITKEEWEEACDKLNKRLKDGSLAKRV